MHTESAVLGRSDFYCGQDGADWSSNEQESGRHGSGEVARPQYLQLPRGEISKPIALQHVVNATQLFEEPTEPVFRREVDSLADDTGTRPFKVGTHAVGNAWFAATLGLQEMAWPADSRGTGACAIGLHRRTFKARYTAGILEDDVGSTSIVAACRALHGEGNGGKTSRVTAEDADAGHPHERDRREILETNEAAAVLGVRCLVIAGTALSSAYHRLPGRIAHARANLLIWAQT